MADHEYRDPALSGVPDSRYDDPGRNPIAYLPVDEPERPWDPGGTYLMPIVARRTPSPRATFTHDNGSVYERPDPDEFDSYDDVDSTTIVDDGGPHG